MPIVSAPASDHVLGEINTTPLIDVMLVLLVMFIITIPIQTHAVKLDLPVATPPEAAQPDPIRNLVTIDARGGLTWNGTAVSEDDLRALLRRTTQMYPAPELHLRPDADADYGTVDRTLALINREGVERMGFVGNERFAAN